MKGQYPRVTRRDAVFQREALAMAIGAIVLGFPSLATL